MFSWWWWCGVHACGQLDFGASKICCSSICSTRSEKGCWRLLVVVKNGMVISWNDHAMLWVIALQACRFRLKRKLINQFFLVYSDELDAIAEWATQMVIEAARNVLTQANLPACLWSFLPKNSFLTKQGRRRRYATLNTPIAIHARNVLLKRWLFEGTVYVLKISRTFKVWHWKYLMRSSGKSKE